MRIEPSRRRARLRAGVDWGRAMATGLLQETSKSPGFAFLLIFIFLVFIFPR